MSQPAAVIDNDATQWVTFYLENETYGLNVLQVQEVLRVSEITPVPGAPDFVLGIINLRGKVVTVLDARRRFHMPSKERDEDNRIIIIETPQHVAGILVDAVAEVVTLRAGEIEDGSHVGTQATARYIRGTHHRDGELLLLVDLQELINDDPSGVSKAALPAPGDNA